VATKSPQQGGFIGGLIAGFALGGVVVMPAAVLTAMLVFTHFSNANPNWAFIAVYVLGVALGIWALALVRSRIDFISGFVGGIAAGLLGLTALCNVLLGGFGNMR
jgi:hypothetical protein